MKQIFRNFVSNIVRKNNRNRFMSSIDRKARKKIEMRQSILQAARDIAVKEGWHSVTIRKIADKIEYAPPIVYEYFENKEALIRELMNLGHQILSDEYASKNITAEDPREFLMQLSLAQWEFAVNNYDLYMLMFSLERPTPSEEMIERMRVLESKFLQLANDDPELMVELITNWVCLVTGSISFLNLIKEAPHQHRKFHGNLKEMYTKNIQRFINSI